MRLFSSGINEDQSRVSFVPKNRLSHPDDRRILDRCPVESFDARTHRRVVRNPLEMVTVLALCQAKPAFVFGPLFRGAIEQEDFMFLGVVPGSGVEDGQVLPGMIRVGGEDGVAGKALEFHHGKGVIPFRDSASS